jgi:hypothetical protein
MGSNRHFQSLRIHDSPLSHFDEHHFGFGPFLCKGGRSTGLDSVNPVY